MKLQSKLIAAGLGAFVLLASPTVQANPSVNATAVTNATNSAVQSAVRNARDDAARRIAQHKSTTRTR